MKSTSSTGDCEWMSAPQCPGCGGGAGAIVLFPADLPHQVYVAFILAGVSAAAMTSYASMRRTYFPVRVAEHSVVDDAYRMGGTEEHLSMAILVACS